MTLSDCLADVQQEENILNVLVTRNPYEWLESMHRHPFYAELHRGVDMQTFLAREWITFKTEAIDKVLTSKQAEVILDHPKPPDTTAPVTDTVVSQCDHLTEQLDDSEACSYYNSSYSCTHLPGLAADSNWITKQHVRPLVECLSANLSRRACSSDFLCSGLSPVSIFANYSLQQWRDRLAHYIRVQSDDSEASTDISELEAKDLNPLDLNKSQWNCQTIPGYLVDKGNELAPSSFCLDGNISWSRCLQGGFLCRANATGPGLWHQARQPEWRILKQRLVAAAKELTQHVKSEALRVKKVEFLKAGMSLDPPLAKHERLEDRDPDTGKRFPNILAMRTAKLRDWFLTADKNLSFSSHVPCRDFFLDPTATLNELRDDFGLEPKASDWQLSQCIMHFGAFMCPKSQNKKEKPQQFSWSAPEALAKRLYYTNGTYSSIYHNISLGLVNAWLDEELENALGYSVYPDLSSLSAPYTLENRCSLHCPRHASVADPPCYQHCHACLEGNQTLVGHQPYRRR